MKRWRVVEFHIVHGEDPYEALCAYEAREIEASDIISVEFIDEWSID